VNDNSLNIYAKEEAVFAVLTAYQKANLDIYLTVIFKDCELGGNVVATGTFPVQHVEGTQIVNDKIEYITLKYRMNINNAPIIKEKMVECVLSFSGEFRLTIVPIASILSISLLDAPDNQINFPYLETSNDIEQNIQEPKQKENNPSKNIKKKKSFLRVVK